MSNRKEVLTAVAAAGIFLGSCNWRAGESHAVSLVDGDFPKMVPNSASEEIFQSGATIFSPGIWNGVENLPWKDSEIAIVTKTLSELPPGYRTTDCAPTRIVLIKVPGTTSPGVGGGYSNGELDLYISEYFLAGAEMYDMAGILYKTQENYLRATLVHEWTHSFIEAQISQDPEFLSGWIQQTGWVLNSGVWENLRPENLIMDGNSYISPNEDIASSVGLFLVNPDALSESRRNFFLTSPFFADWQAVLDYRNSHQ